jgi:uncharacterized protein
MRFILFLSVIFCLVGISYSQIIPSNLLPPKPTPGREFAMVVDQANMLSGNQKFFLEEKLRAFRDSTSNQIVVVTVETLHGYQPYEYATEIIHQWGIGDKKNDNGVVLLISNGKQENNKRKVFIGVGYGLEGAIPDGLAGLIVRNEIIPTLKENNYYQAVLNGVTAIQQAAVKEYKIKDEQHVNSSNYGLIFIVLIVLFFIIASRLNKRTLSGGYGSRRGFRNFNGPIFLPPFIGGGGGFFDNDGGGGPSMPDFGGFGGGDSGGGGAGGDW